MAKTKDTYKEVRTYETPGWVVRVHIPDLTPEERTKRLEAIKQAAADLVLNTTRKECKA